MKSLWSKLFFIALALTACVSFATWDTIYYSFQEQVDVYSEKSDGYDYKGKGTGGNIKADVDVTFGEAGSIVTTTTRRRGGSTKTTKYYYIIPVTLNKELCFVCTEVSERKKSDFESLLNGAQKTIPLTGTFKKLDDEMYKYMVDCMKDIDSYYQNQLFKNDADLKAHVVQLCLVPLDFESRNTCIGAIAGFAALTIFFLFMWLRKSKKQKAPEAAEYQATMAQENMNQTFSSPETAEPFVPTDNSATTSEDTATENATGQYHSTLDQFNDKHN